MSSQYSDIDKQSLEEGGNEKVPEQNNTNKIFGIIGAGILICLSVIFITIFSVIIVVVCFIVLALALAFIDYYVACRDDTKCFAYFWHLIYYIVIKLDIPPGQFITSLVRMMMLIVNILIFALELCVCLIVVIVLVVILVCGIIGLCFVVLYYTNCIGTKVGSIKGNKPESSENEQS